MGTTMGLRAAVCAIVCICMVGVRGAPAADVVWGPPAYLSSAPQGHDLRSTFTSPTRMLGDRGIVAIPLLEPSGDYCSGEVVPGQHLPWTQSHLSPSDQDAVMAKINTAVQSGSASNRSGNEAWEAIRPVLTTLFTRPAPAPASRSQRRARHEPVAMDLGVEMTQKTEEFNRIAKALVPAMSASDLRRAGMNARSMLWMQALVGVPMRVTRSVAAFSLLYPRTDDIVDSTALPVSQRKSFLQRFARQVSHGDSTPIFDYEVDVWRMFRLIEQDWPRARFPVTYRVMGELLQAQKDSQVQFGGPRHGAPMPGFRAVWEVTMRKGALSALCDAYLTLGNVHDNEASFAAHFGTVAQLLNDLTGIDDDLRDGQYTPLNMVHASGRKLDDIAGQFYSYLQATFTNTPHIKGRHTSHATRKRRRLVAWMMAFTAYKFVEGVSVNQDKFSPEFLARINATVALPLHAVARLYRARHERA
ncbi:unnamed protein product (mitochondrion) [Plasmodiophora brassicae]|uniref:Uncharacterized protein n=2 Tax=Plasmodiophora brassicae TaxID=37360 RepID=A0A3P3YMW3_PLABS|nr:unnamed protein product [Plasmodiophora brassicae]